MKKEGDRISCCNIIFKISFNVNKVQFMQKVTNSSGVPTAHMMHRKGKGRGKERGGGREGGGE